MRYAILIQSILAAGGVRADEAAIDFNRDIRPILSENCFTCHGQDGSKRKADLRLDVRELAIKNGAIVPKNAVASEMIKRIHAADAAERMPPPKSNRPCRRSRR